MNRKAVDDLGVLVSIVLMICIFNVSICITSRYFVLRTSRETHVTTHTSLSNVVSRMKNTFLRLQLILTPTGFDGDVLKSL